MILQHPKVSIGAIRFFLGIETIIEEDEEKEKEEDENEEIDRHLYFSFQHEHIDIQRKLVQENDMSRNKSNSVERN